MQYVGHHIWGASEGLLERILNCYIWERSLAATSCTGEIPSRVDTDPEFHRPFQQC